MKRDMDLVREILLKLESYEEPAYPGYVPIEGHDKLEVDFHVRLMWEAGLVDVFDTTGSGEFFSYIQPRITWNGYEFLDAARDDKRWKEAKTIFNKVGGVAFDMVIAVLTDLANTQIKTLMTTGH